MWKRYRGETVVGDNTLIGHEEGGQDAPVWSAGFLAEVQANCHSLTAEDVKNLTAGLSHIEIAAEGVVLAAQLEILSAERGN